MLVDWFTTTAQIINFLILVWLLKRFLYKPILRAMEQRQQHVANALKDAGEQKTKAENERLAFEQQARDLAQERQQILRSAVQQADAERKKLTADAREEVKRLETQWRELITSEKEVWIRQCAAYIEQEILDTTRQILSDLAGASLGTTIAQRFVERLNSFTREEKEQLVTPDLNSQAIVASASELAEGARTEIEAAVKQALGTIPVRFVVSPEIIGGIEVSINGRKISWTIRDYLSSLQRELDKVIAQEGVEHVQSGL